MNDNLQLSREEFIQLIDNTINSEKKVTYNENTPVSVLLQELSIYFREVEFQNDELRETQIKLERSRNEMLELLETAPVGYVMYNNDHKIIISNQYFDNLLKKGRKAVLSSCFTDYIAPESQDNFYLHLRALSSKQTISSQTEVILNSENEQIPTKINTITRLHNNEIHYLSAITDISELKKTEKELGESREKLWEILHNAPLHIFAHDGKQFIFNNKESLRYLNLPENHQINFTEWKNSIHPEDHEKFMTKFSQILRKREMMETTFRMENAKHEYKTFWHLSVPVYNTHDQFKYFIGFNIDVSERIRAEKALEKSKKELQRYTAHLHHIREDERAVLAREVHDELGQILVATKIEAGLLKNLVLHSTEKVVLKELFEAFEKLIDNTIKTTRKILTGLRSDVLEILGLEESMVQYIKSYESRYEISCKTEFSINHFKCDEEVKLSIFRIIQEALTNVVKHAHAKNAIIKIVYRNNILNITISDDGIGFDESAIKNDSFGILGMKERVSSMNGTFKINRVNKNGGTIIKIVIPLTC